MLVAVCSTTRKFCGAAGRNESKVGVRNENCTQSEEDERLR